MDSESVFWEDQELWTFPIKDPVRITVDIGISIPSKNTPIEQSLTRMNADRDNYTNH